MAQNIRDNLRAAHHTTMYSMKLTFVLLAVIAAASCGVVNVQRSWKGGLRAKFEIGLNVGLDYFFNVPQTVSEAVLDGWTLTERPEGPLPSLMMFCPPRPIVCALYDDSNYVAGLQVSLPDDEFTDSVLDWEAQGFTKWSPSDDTKTYWSIQQYFVSQEYLAIDKEERIASRDSNSVLQQDGVWVTGTKKDILKISRDTAQIENSIFTKQACVPWMGGHYYYNMTTQTECTSEGMYPWFPLTDSGELIGTGFMTIGKMPVYERDWFERPEKIAVMGIVPNGPQCLYDLAASSGIVTMHIYYIDEPWTITC